MSSFPSPTLRRVVENDLCTGCGLCAGLAPGSIAMKTVAPGFSRPKQLAQLDSETEARIADTCPGSIVAPWHKAPVNDPIWGPAFRVMTGHSTDEDIRYCGSSGGVVSGLAFHALTSGMIDKVMHIGADPANPTRNTVRWATTREQIIAGAGSRYAASSPLAEIGEVLDQPGRFAFVGKPCDISALRQLARIDARVNEKFPLMLSFFCAGVPSHDGADRVIDAMGLDPAKVIDFRYRGHGWPGKARAVTSNGKVGELSYAESWGKHLSREIQFRCKICPDGVGGAADIACADAWYGGDSGYPSFEEEDGRSLILSRTSVGDALLSDAIARGAIEATPLTIGEIRLMQPAQQRRKAMLRARLAACLVKGRSRPKMSGLLLGKAARHAPLLTQIREFLGTFARIIRR